MTTPDAPDPATAKPLPLDPDLARWLERSEAVAFFECAAAAAELPGKPAGAVVQPIADGFAFSLTALDMGFFNRGIGIGADGTVREADIEAASRFFLDLGQTQSLIQFAPATLNPELIGWLEARGYRGGRNWVKLWHDLEAVPAPQTSLRVERIDASEAATFASIVIEAFGLPPEASVVASAVVGRPGWSHFLAYDGDTAVSAAAMFVTEGVAWLGFGATREAARGRGGQSALFATRLREARDQGCRWAITETGEETPEEPVNHSYRNMLRSGFRLAYARQNWVRIPR